MILSLSALMNTPLQVTHYCRFMATSGDQEELAIWTEGYVQGNKTDKRISKLIHVYSPTLQCNYTRESQISDWGGTYQKEFFRRHIVTMKQVTVPCAN